MTSVSAHRPGLPSAPQAPSLVPPPTSPCPAPRSSSARSDLLVILSLQKPDLLREASATIARLVLLAHRLRGLFAQRSSQPAPGDWLVQAEQGLGPRASVRATWPNSSEGGRGAGAAPRRPVSWPWLCEMGTPGQAKPLEGQSGGHRVKGWGEGGMRLRLPGAGHLLPPLPSRPGATGTSLSSSQPPPPLTAPAALADTGAQRAGATVEPLSPCGSQTPSEQGLAHVLLHAAHHVPCGSLSGPNVPGAQTGTDGFGGPGSPAGR